jgi:two-component system KDP operon response regulator KdpE
MSDPAKILVIDDDEPIRRFLAVSLPEDAFSLLQASTAGEGERCLRAHTPDLLLLDLGLPDKDGVQIVRDLREWSDVPVIVLSARGSEGDKVAALDAGADDYLTKPFGINELLARMRVALRKRRPGAGVEQTFESKELHVDFATREVYVRGSAVHLTPKEYSFLALLVRHAGMVVTHKQILSAVWGPGYADESHYLRLYMAQLRHKLERDPTKPKLLHTEPGVGYRLIISDL